MVLIVGLGNPTKKYENNRHNIGFKVIDSLVDELKAVNITKASFKGALFKSNNTLLLKPFTYMNLSGESVRTVVKYYKVQKVIVVHDEIDLALGIIKIKNDGGNGGHNGLRSIDKYFGTNYDRVRIGVGKPQNKEDVSYHVLSDFTKDELECVNLLVPCATQIAKDLLLHDIQYVANKHISKKSICL